MSFPVEPLDFLIEIALDADRNLPPDSWDWEDISQYGREKPQVVIGQGDADAFDNTPPATCTVTLDNRDGRFSKSNPLSPYYGRFGDNTPIRVSVDSDGAGWLPRFGGEVGSWPKRWNIEATDSTVPISCAGISRRLAQGTAVPRSALRRAMEAGTRPQITYWPLEDATGATTGVASLPNHHPMTPSPGLPMGSVAGPAGSLPLPDLSQGGHLTASVPPLPTSNGWTITLWSKSAAATALAVHRVLHWVTPDTVASLWEISVRADGTLDVTTYTSAGVGTLQMSFAAGLIDDEWHQFEVSAEVSGGDLAATLYLDGVSVDTASIVGAAGALALIDRVRIGPLNLPDTGLSSVGHLLIVQAGTLVTSYAFMSAGSGYALERAGRRIERTCGDARIPLRIPNPYRVIDSFVRTSVAGWGTTDTGQSWTRDGGVAADFDVSAGRATIEQSTASALRAMILGDPPQLNTDEFDVRVLIEVPQVATGGAVGMHAGVVARWTSDTAHVRCQLRFTSAAVSVGWVEPGGAGTGIGSAVEVASSYSAADRFWLRAVGVAGSYRAKAWREDDAEPFGWTAFGESTTYLTGSVGLFARRGVGDTSVSATMVFEQFASRHVLDETEPMGVQAVAADMAVLRDAETTDGGTLADDPTTPGLIYVPRVARYNMPHALDLVVQDGDIGAAPEGTDDDQQRWNRVVANRTGGGSAIAQDDAAIAASGVTVETGHTVNTASDLSLPHQAGWHLALGADHGDRWPKLTLNLVARPELIAAWCAVTPGAARMRVTGMPDQAGPDPVDVVIEGWEETLSSFGWLVEAFCSPAKPWTVGVIEDEILGRADTDGAHLGADVVAGTDTTMVVVSTDGPQWIASSTHPTMFPPTNSLHVRSSGVELAVTGISALVDDAFGRTVVNGWGTATTGQVWGNTATTTAFGVTGGVGQHLVPARGGSYRTHVTGLVLAALDVQVTSLLASAPTGDFVREELIFRYIDANNFYGLRLHVMPSGSIDLQLIRIASGSETVLTAATAPVTHSAGVSLHIRVSMPDTLMRGRVWRDGTVEPRIWHINASDSTHVTGTVGIASLLHPSNTNPLPYTVVYDNFRLLTPQTFTIQQTPVNGVVKTIPAGSPVSLADPWRAAL